MAVPKALVAIDFSQSEAKIISFLIDHQKSTVDEMMVGTTLSRATIYKCLNNLVSKDYVSKSEKIPYVYSPTNRLLSDIKSKFNKFYRQVNSEIRPKKIVERRTMLKKITTIFEKNNYSIKEPSKKKMDMLERRYEPWVTIDKIAEGEYSFGILLLDKTKKLEGESERLSLHLSRDIWAITREFNLISTFVFVHMDRRGQKTLMKKLKQIPDYRYRLVRNRIENYGITGNRLYVISTEENIQLAISSILEEIHQRRIVVGNMALTLKNKIKQAQELILLSQEHGRRIESMFLNEPTSPFTKVNEILNEIIDPVQRIKNREIRNLGIFRRQFNENEILINQSLEAIERRIFLPPVNRLERYLAELESILEKFRCIEYELNDLRSALFNYGVNLMELGSSASINPFIFTEPYEKEPFFVNEERLKSAAKNLSKSILENLPSFFQIVQGNAGIGKTHAAKYIYGSIMEKEKIKTMYIDVPLNYDLVAGIFQEMTQESLFPTNLVGTVRELRRSTPSTPRDLLRILDEITDLWKKQGYKGLLVILDEIENAVPYIYVQSPYSRKNLMRNQSQQPPLALRQIKELISLRMISNLGFLFCCRSRIYPMIRDALKIKNIESFSFQPEKLTSNYLKELIQHRYEMWSIGTGPRFEKSTIDEIINITGGNTRDVIKYFRELFGFAIRNDLKKIGKTSIKEIGSIPLFRY